MEYRNFFALADLEAGRAHFAFYTDEALPAGFHHLPPFVEGFAALLRKGHPILASRDQAGHIDPSLMHHDSI